MTYKELLNRAIKRIEEAGLEETVAKLLLIHYTKESLANIYANLNEKASEDVIKKFNEGLDLYVLKEIPLSYITGTQDFFGYEFIVNEDVLIPRRETEELVERVIYYIEDNLIDKNIEVLDIGTGSGCIAITLDKELENINVTAIDISEKALNVAISNNDKLKTNVNFLLGNLYEPVEEKKFDIIVSNPPYIKNDGFIGRTVKHEPKVSLYGGDDGLDFYKKIINGAKNHLKSNGVIAFEHGYNMARELEEIALNEFPQATVTLYKDLSSYDRITFIEIGEIDG